MPADLKRFIESGSPPIFMTMGSMMSTEATPEEITSLLVRSALLAGCRAIIQSNWDEIPDIPDHPQIYKIRTVPHQHVLPSCEAIVHHGGAGTDNANIEHILEHDVIPDEVEEACVNKPYLRKTAEGRYLVFGVSDKGRYLFIVGINKSRGVFRTITARDMTTREKSLYKRR